MFSSGNQIPIVTLAVPGAKEFMEIRKPGPFVQACKAITVLIKESAGTIRIQGLIGVLLEQRLIR
jgi:hypothetical protein